MRLARWLLLVAGAAGAGVCVVALADSPAFAYGADQQRTLAASNELAPDREAAPGRLVTDLIGSGLASVVGELPAGERPSGPGDPPVESGADAPRPVPKGSGAQPEAGGEPGGVRIPSVDRHAEPAHRAPVRTVDGPDTWPTRLVPTAAHSVGLVPTAIEAVSTTVTGASPDFLRDPVRDLITPVVGLTDQLLGVLLPPVDVCPVEPLPEPTPPPVTGPAGGENRGGGAQVLPAGASLESTAVRAATQLPSLPRTVVLSPSDPVVSDRAAVRPSGPLPPAAPGQLAIPDGDNALSAERGGGPGPMIHRGGDWSPRDGYAGPVADRHTPAVGRSCAVVARPG